MIKRLAATGFLFGLIVAAAPLAPAAAADCGLAGLLSPCVAPLPSPQPSPLPLPPLAAAPALPTTPAPVVTPAPAPPPPAVPSAASRSAVPAAADRLLQLVNEARIGAGLPGLTVNSRAASIAARHTMAMAERGDIYHNPAYLTAATRSSLGARALGENVAMNGSLEAAHQRLMASPGHRANILNGAFDAVGIAVVRDAGGTLFLTQNFLDSAGTAPSASPLKAAAKAAAAPTAPRPAAVYRVASVPAAATAAPSGAAPDAVVSTSSADDVAIAELGTAAPSPGGGLGLSAAAALGLLVSMVGAGIRVWIRA